MPLHLAPQPRLLVAPRRPRPGRVPARSRRSDTLLRLLADCSRSVDGPAALPAALDRLLARASTVLGADAAGVWLHDRRSRLLIQVVTPSIRTPALDGTVATADVGHPLASALRAANPVCIRSASGRGRLVLASLTGRRRALGVLALRARRQAMLPALVHALDTLREGLAAAIENVLLLDDVVRARKELEHVFDALTELVVVVDGRDRIVHVNQAFADRLQAAPRDLIDTPIASHVGIGLSSWMAAQERNVPGTAVTCAADAKLGGLFDIRLTVLPHAERTDAPPSRVLVARDISGDVCVELERRELEGRLRRSEQLLALGRFVAGVAHELNNPLQGVLGHLELLRRQRDLPPAMRRDLATAWREAGRAARIVRHLLLFAGSGRLRRRPVLVNALVRRVLRDYAAAHRRQGIEVKCRLAPGMPTVAGDAVLLRQAIDNLIVNAAQAMGGPGALMVCTSASRNQVRVTIEDTGPGLSPEVRARLFEPFFTTKDVGRGTGLGLAMVFGILQAHGGSVEGGNRTGGGARFTLTLPAALVRSRSARTRTRG
ncbi:MAG TPA: ATP-binding protein [Vicinamibacterales bacterium]